MQRSIRYFLLRSVAVLSPVPLLLLAAYIVLDPYRTLRRYDNYFAENPLYVNKTLVSVETYLNRRARGAEFDSFIFGPSVSASYLVEDWKGWIGRDTRPFHFDGSSDRLAIIADKFEWLAERDTIRNALIVVDARLLAVDKDRPVVCGVHPALRHYRNWLPYHYTFFSAFSDVNLLMSYVPYLVTGQKVMYSPKLEEKTTVFEVQDFSQYRPDINEEYNSIGRKFTEDEFKRNFGISVTTAGKPEVLPRQLTARDAADLRRIAAVAARQHTRLKLIVAPNIQALILNPADAALLRSTLGANSVADLSGSMLADALQADSLYFDPVHYRPELAVRYLQAAYAKP